MTELELITACIKNDKTAKKQFFDLYYKKLGYIALRYCKNKAQSEPLTIQGIGHVFSQLNSFKSQSTLSLYEFIKHEFIKYTISYIKNIRNEYYVASTVKAAEQNNKSYDLFLDSSYVDLKSMSQDVLLKAIQDLVPSQRVVFNLHVIDNYNLSAISDILETSEQTIKSNLEKSRFNLQKLVENKIKLQNHERAL
jgi:RNA polymerase sigma factor (sigma-70 family)